MTRLSTQSGPETVCQPSKSGRRQLRGNQLPGRSACGRGVTVLINPAQIWKGLVAPRMSVASPAEPVLMESRTWPVTLVNGSIVIINRTPTINDLLPSSEHNFAWFEGVPTVALLTTR